MKKIFLLIIGLLFSLHGISQQVPLIEGIHLSRPHDMVKLNKEELKTFIHEQKFSRKLSKKDPRGTYRIGNALIGVYDFKGDIKDDLDELKVSWDKYFKKDTSYRASLKHIGNYRLYAKSYRLKYLDHYTFSAIDDAHKFRLNIFIVSHTSDKDKLGPITDGMLSSLSFTELPNKHSIMKKITTLIIPLLFSLCGLCQEIQLLPGIQMRPPKGATRLYKDQLKAYLHQQAYPRHLINMRPPNIYKVDDMLVGMYANQGNFTVSLEKSKADWDKSHKAYKKNPIYGSFINHINNYDVFEYTYEKKNSLITNFFAVSISHKLLLHGVIIYHITDYTKAFATLNEMLYNLKFTDNSELNDTVKVKKG